MACSRWMGRSRGSRRSATSRIDPWRTGDGPTDSHAVGFNGAHAAARTSTAACWGRVDILTGTLGKALGAPFSRVGAKSGGVF